MNQLLNNDIVCTRGKIVCFGGEDSVVNGIDCQKDAWMCVFALIVCPEPRDLAKGKER